MRALVTGVAGQDGYLLSAELKTRGWEVTGSKLNYETLLTNHPLTSSELIDLDVGDAESVHEVIRVVEPDVIFHLAGISSVDFSIREPELTNAVNVGGTRNILESVLQQGLFKTHVIHAASTEIYSNQETIVSESSPLGPRSPYGESKAMAFEVCRDYRGRGLMATNAVLANHESFLRSVDFVTGKIANGVARISLGLQDQITLGNIDVAKDWSAATDIVEGLILISEKQFVGDVILASGQPTRLEDLIQTAFAHVGIVNWKDYVKSDTALVRAGESKLIRIDTSKALSELGWHAVTPMAQWMGEMVQCQIDQLKSEI
jgi:GDPmannose 4,6-dehydratase